MKRVSDKRRKLLPERLAMRAEVLLRDGGCQAIGIYDHECSSPVDVHHLWRVSQGGPWQRWNLISLCRTAHTHVHANPEWAYKVGLLVRSSSGQLGCVASQALRELARRNLT